MVWYLLKKWGEGNVTFSLLLAMKCGLIYNAEFCEAVSVFLCCKQANYFQTAQTCLFQYVV